MGALNTDWNSNSLHEHISRTTLFDVEKVNRLIEEVFRYLWLLSANPEENKVSPAAVVDQALHCLLLDPILYERVCDAILIRRGCTREAHRVRVLPHNPLGGDDADKRRIRYEKCVRDYATAFKQSPPVEFWPLLEVPTKVVDSVVGKRKATDDLDQQQQQQGLQQQQQQQKQQQQQQQQLLPATPVPERGMVIKILQLTGKRTDVAVRTTDTILEVKRKLQEKENIPVDRQRLVFRGVQQQDARTVAECGIVDGNTVHLVLHVAGSLKSLQNSTHV